MSYLPAIAAGLTAVLLFGLAPADAAVHPITGDKHSAVKFHGPDAYSPKRIEPYRFKARKPTRLSVELWSGAEYVVTPCKKRQKKNCFRWSGPFYVNIYGRTYPL